MSTDYMTRRQWEKRCGEVMTYQLGKPMLWDEFCSLPKNIQKEYLLGMIEKYHTTASDLAKMFHISPSKVTKLCKDGDIAIVFSPGKRMSKEKREEFMSFLSKESVDACEPDKQNEAQSVTGRLTSVPAEEKNADMVLTSFTLNFDGKVNRDMLINSILYMLPQDVNVSVKVQCDIVNHG